jgi:TolB-like protein/Tfp pilus assembly protein PilF
MFTDIVGYTSLMGKDEDKAFRILRANRKIQRQQIAGYHGKWLKEIGDGILASFDSASEAVRCATKIQEVSKAEGYSLRIGIHEGEVVFEENDVFGDGVNVASRLQELARAGSTFISGAVNKDIRNKVDIITEFIEEKALKNVDEPVKIYEVLTGSAEKNKTEQLSRDSKTKNGSIAVLPFLNMSDDPAQEYFCDGITEEIINALSHIERLKVIARTSVFMFKGKHEDAREIGRKLNVGTLLEGSVRKVGNRIRINTKLINTSDGAQVWSESYNRVMEDIFAIQDEISLSIVDNLKLKLIQKERSAIVKKHTKDLDSYDLYLKGKYYSERMTEEGFKMASKYFQRALEEDPNFALAHMGLAYINWFSTYWGSAPPETAYPRSKSLILKALSIDRDISDAHNLLGSIYMNHEWKWEKAEEEYRLALQLNPNNAFSHIYYSFLMTVRERHDEAIKIAKRAFDLDPLSNYIHTLYGASYLYAGQLKNGIKELQAVLDYDPNYFLAYFYLGFNFRANNMLEQARKVYKKAVLLSGNNPMATAALMVTTYELGQIEKAEKLRKELEERAKKEYIPPICFYLYYKTIGDEDQAYLWIEKCCQVHDSFLPWMRVHPIKKLRIPNEAKYNALLSEAGLKN